MNVLYPLRTAALALFVIGPALASFQPGGDPSADARVLLERGDGHGTVLLPEIGSDGLLAAVLLSEDGASRYGLDGTLTLWIPHSIVAQPPLHGGLYGHVFEAYAPEGFKAAVEGTWRMLDESTGRLEASLLAADESGVARVIGSVVGKFRVERPDRGRGSDAAQAHPSGASGELRLEYLVMN